MNGIFYFPPSMYWPLAACLVLTGIHVYLGVHVIARKVIFVDLALAQIAALGTVIGVLLGYEVGRDITQLYLYSLAFTIFGAFIFAATKMKGEKVPHEAIIGIVYAVTFAATILVLSKSPLGPQELDHIIKGELLWVQAPTVIKTAVIYACVGLFHFIFRKKFMAISFDPAGAYQSGMKVRLWDFLFYMSFGFVITSSVAIAGVFLVFSYLVIPSVGAMLISDKLSRRLIAGWIGGSVISLVGVKLSWDTGLPTSPLIVVLFAGALICSGIYRYLVSSERKIIAARNLAASFVIVLIFIGGLVLFRKSAEDPLTHALHRLESPIGTERQTALEDLQSYPRNQDRWFQPVMEKLNDPDAGVRKTAIDLLAGTGNEAAAEHILSLLNDPSDEVRQSALKAAGAIGGQKAASILVDHAKTEDDPEFQVNLLGTALSLGDRDAIPPLLVIAGGNSIFAQDAMDSLASHVDGPIKTMKPAEIRGWWEMHKVKMNWDPAQRIFVLPAQ